MNVKNVVKAAGIGLIWTVAGLTLTLPPTIVVCGIILTCLTEAFISS